MKTFIFFATDLTNVRLLPIFMLHKRLRPTGIQAWGGEIILGGTLMTDENKRLTNQTIAIFIIWFVAMARAERELVNES